MSVCLCVCVFSGYGTAPRLVILKAGEGSLAPLPSEFVDISGDIGELPKFSPGASAPEMNCKYVKISEGVCCQVAGRSTPQLCTKDPFNDPNPTVSRKRVTYRNACFLSQVRMRLFSWLRNGNAGVLDTASAKLFDYAKSQDLSTVSGFFKAGPSFTAALVLNGWSSAADIITVITGRTARRNSLTCAVLCPVPVQHPIDSAGRMGERAGDLIGGGSSAVRSLLH